jgi:PhzF family phenazine biosynthesis protein
MARRGPKIPFFLVDAFADKPFTGNPAAVCMLDDEMSPEAMKAIARELNFSETAFVLPANADGIRNLRWFTPTVEVPLCGHATLATAHVLIRELEIEPPVRFETLSGILMVEKEPEGWLRMDFPADPPIVEEDQELEEGEEPVETPEGLLEALGVPKDTPTFRGTKIWGVRLKTEKAIIKLEPDMAALREVKLGKGYLGVSVTAKGTAGNDFASRFFGPWVGVDEDPVTGMAHTTLGPYWMKEMNAIALRAKQVSKRGGLLRVREDGDRIMISGKALTVVKGTLLA